MRRRDFFAEHIIDKSFIENVMKSITWTTLCGAVFAISMATLKSGEYFQWFLILSLFLLLSTITIMYVALHVIIPLDSAMYPDDPYWDEKSQKLKGVAKAYEAIKVFVTRRKIFYLVLCLGYVLYAHKVAIYLASKA